MAVDPTHDIRLLGVPAGLFLESQNHQHDLIRELTLIDMGNRFDVTQVELSHRLAGLIRDILQDYADVRMATREQALAAIRRADEMVDLTIEPVPDLVPALRRWLALAEEADDLCSQGSLLTVAASPEVRRLRRWYVDAIAKCCETGAAQRWNEEFASPGS